MEYRKPAVKDETRIMDEMHQTGQPVTADMIKRYLGLITVGRPMIAKIEVEERRTDLSGQMIPARPKP
jgi:hypothetical protein